MDSVTDVSAQVWPDELNSSALVLYAPISNGEKNDRSISRSNVTVVTRLSFICVRCSKLGVTVRLPIGSCWSITEKNAYCSHSRMSTTKSTVRGTKPLWNELAFCFRRGEGGWAQFSVACHLCRWKHVRASRSPQSAGNRLEDRSCSLTRNIPSSARPFTKSRSPRAYLGDNIRSRLNH